MPVVGDTVREGAFDLTVDDDPIRAVGAEPLIGVDTEFMREKTFFAELCLLQISTRDRIFCADPLGADGDGAPADDLWQAIMHSEWVLHSGRQDFEVIYQAAGRLPDNVFDTQVAAALLGFQPQIGYAGLVKELFDIELAKTHTRADWSKRPIADALLNYAAEDVQFLLPARDALIERLERSGRLDWALQDSRDLLDVALYQTDPGAAIQRLKGARNLRGRARAAAAALAAWREQQAIRSNRPRQWIIRDSVLVDLARQKIVPIYGLNYKDQSDEAKAWLARFGDPYVMSLVDEKGKIGIDYGVYGVPETYLIDRDGIIRYKKIGPVTPDTVREKILPLLKQLKG